MRFQIEFRRTEMPPKKKEKKKAFIWSDDEVELLLNIANDYKTSKAAESVDWESVKCGQGAGLHVYAAEILIFIIKYLHVINKVLDHGQSYLRLIKC